MSLLPASLISPHVCSATLNSALEEVHRLVGDEEKTGVADKLVRDVLWDNYFDIEKTVEWMCGSSSVYTNGCLLTFL